MGRADDSFTIYAKTCQPMLHSSSREGTCVLSVERITAHTSADGVNLRLSGDEFGDLQFVIDVRYPQGHSKSVGSNSMGFDFPLGTKYPICLQRFVSRVGPARVRPVQIRDRAHPFVYSSLRNLNCSPISWHLITLNCGLRSGQSVRWRLSRSVEYVLWSLEEDRRAR